VIQLYFVLYLANCTHCRAVREFQKRL